MSYTDEQLEALAARYENGIPEDELDQWVSVPGPYAWMLNVVDDPDALEEQARRENRTIPEVMREAINLYLQSKQQVA